METPGGERAGFDRLSQIVTSYFSRRAIGKWAAGLLVAGGFTGNAEAKKKRKKKKKNGAPNSPTSPGAPGPTCTPVCSDGFTCTDGACVCAGPACNDTCCPADASCIRGECCPPTRVCDGNCCSNGQYCANIVPGGVKGCCSSPLSIRGETCCPTGSLATRLNCGSYQCNAGLSGTGPGGCDLWCKIGFEGSLCGPGVPGIPTGENNGRACCCTAVGTNGTCVWP